MNNNKPLEAEVFNSKNVPIKKGLVSKLTESGAFVYDPKKAGETAECAEWFAFSAPNGTRTNVFGGE